MCVNGFGGMQLCGGVQSFPQCYFELRVFMSVAIVYIFFFTKSILGYICSFANSHLPLLFFCISMSVLA